MQLRGGSTYFSATDLVGYLECEHLTALDPRNLYKPSPRAQDDESAALIVRKGNEHERAFLAKLRSSGYDVLDASVGGGSTDDKATRTIAAMQAGTGVIYQATLRLGNLFGHADFLHRVARPSP